MLPNKKAILHMELFFTGARLVTLTGLSAGLLTAISMLPQVIKTVQKKKAEEVSLWMLITLVSGVCLWILYGIEKSDYPIIITNSVSLIINFIMICLRHKYK